MTNARLMNASVGQTWAFPPQDLDRWWEWWEWKGEGRLVSVLSQDYRLRMGKGDSLRKSLLIEMWMEDEPAKTIEYISSPLLSNLWFSLPPSPSSTNDFVLFFSDKTEATRWEFPYFSITHSSHLFISAFILFFPSCYSGEGFLLSKLFCPH